MIPKIVYDLVVIAILLLISLVIIKHKNRENFENPKFEIPELFPKKTNYKNDVRLNEAEKPDIKKDFFTKFVNYYQGNGLTRLYPLKTGSREINYQNDTGVLKHFRVNTYLNTDSIELTYPELELLLNNIQDKGNYQVKFKSIKLVKDDKLNLDYIHDNIIKKTMELINQTYDEGNYETVFNLDDERKYKIFKKQILTDTEVEGITADNRMVIFFLSFYKPDKDYHFTL